MIMYIIRIWWIKLITTLLIIIITNSNVQLSDVNKNNDESLGLGGLDDVLPQIHKVYSLKNFGPKAKLDAKSITVSGFSSGGYMSMQFHVAYSSIIKGAGIFGGGPYARNFGTPAGTIVGSLNLLTTVLVPTVTAKPTSQLVNQAKKFESEGHIDSLKNLKGSKAFIFHGIIDPVVKYTEGIQVKQLYQALGANAKMKTLDRCSHGVPAKVNGGPCGLVNIQKDCVNKCNYEGIYEMFRHLYNDFKEPSNTLIKEPSNTLIKSPTHGSLFYTFDQTPFIPANYSSSKGFMAPTGFIYIPTGCQKTFTTCRLHLALHGCIQSMFTEYGILGNPFALETGYTQVADANNVVIIFPQPAPHYIDAKKSNVACWDALRGTTEGFPYKTAPEMQALYNIVAEMIGLPKIK